MGGRRKKVLSFQKDPYNLRHEVGSSGAQDNGDVGSLQRKAQRWALLWNDYKKEVRRCVTQSGLTSKALE